MTCSRTDPATGSTRARERRVLRRALTAGALTWAGLAAVLGIGFAPAGGRAVLAALVLALAAGGLVAAGWAALALALDVLAGRPPTRRRLLWTVGLGALGMLAPLFAAAATP